MHRPTFFRLKARSHGLIEHINWYVICARTVNEYASCYPHKPKRGSSNSLQLTLINLLLTVRLIAKGMRIYVLSLLQKQGENSQEMMLGTGCFKSGPLSVHVTIPRRGFAVGQSIPFSVDIENHSRKKLNVRMALVQVYSVATYLLCSQMIWNKSDAFITSFNGGSKCFARVCLSVCLSVCLLVRLLKNACMDLDEMLHVDWLSDYQSLITKGLMSGHGRTD